VASQPPADFRRLLQALFDHRVECIVVGGVAAVLHGAPLTTIDLDVVHARTPENVARLLAALKELDARSRLHPSRRLVPDASHLASAGHQLLSTASGPLDLLGAVGHGRGYDDLLPRSVVVELAGGLHVRVADLPMLIELKREAGRDKDLAVLPVLLRTLEARGGR
jgi:hypothetical protein